MEQGKTLVEAEFEVSVSITWYLMTMDVAVLSILISRAQAQEYVMLLMRLTGLSQVHNGQRI